MNTVLLILQAGADFCTLILGGFGVYQLVFRRKKIAGHLQHFLNLLKAVRTTSAVTQIRATIVQLRNLNYDQPDSRKTIKALMGDLEGQLDSVADGGERLQKLKAELHERLANWRGFSEMHKRRLLSGIEGQLEAITHNNNEQMVKHDRSSN